VQEAGVHNGFEAVDDVPENGNCFLFGEFLTLLKEVVEIALIAELCDYVAVVDRAVDVVAFEDVDVVDLLQRIDFSFEHLPGGSVSDGFEVDHLNRDLLLGFLIYASEHTRTEPFANEVVESV
jgi:hypothetical protein